MPEKENFRQENNGAYAPDGMQASPVSSKSVINAQNGQSVSIDVNGKFPGAVAIDINADAAGVAVGVQGKGRQPAMPAPMPMPMPAPMPMPTAPMSAAAPAAVPQMPPQIAAVPVSVSVSADETAEGADTSAGTEKDGRSVSPRPLLPSGTDIALPVRGKVVNRRGKKIGKVREAGLYDAKGNLRGEFCKEGGNVFLYRQERRAGYVDKNDNIFTLANEYVGTIRRFRWLTAFIVVLILLLCTVTSVALSAYYIAASGWYAPVLFVATENGESWQDEEKLPVFANEIFGNATVAPGMQGNYRFVFENRNEDALTYSLTFGEENEYDIEMVYRLKRDGAYVSGAESWLSATELKTEGLTIEPHSSTVFELQWYWRDNDETDTAAGESGAVYTLHISLSAQVDKRN